MTHKLHWDFCIQTDPLRSARRPDLIINNNNNNNKKKKNENLQNGRLCCPGWPQSKIESEKDKYLDLARELKKLWNMRVAIIPIVIRALGDVAKGLIREGLRNKCTSGDNSNYCIIEVDQNTEKSPGDLRKLDVTQTPVKDHQLALMWKTQGVNNNNNNDNNNNNKSALLL